MKIYTVWIIKCFCFYLIDSTPGSNGVGNQSRELYKQSNSNSSKRTYSQMITGKSHSDGKFNTILSPIHEDLEMIIKRAHIENRGARRLFSQSTDTTTICDKSYDYDKPSTSSYVPEFKNTALDENDTSIPFSPTSNLPNFVIDGTAPHLLQMSPEKYKGNVDWLTKIREKYKEQRTKISTEKLPSPKPSIPVRRSSRSKSMEPLKGCKNTSLAPSLLDFFKISNKDCDKNICSENSNTLSLPSIS